MLLAPACGRAPSYSRSRRPNRARLSFEAGRLFREARDVLPTDLIKSEGIEVEPFQ